METNKVNDRVPVGTTLVKIAEYPRSSFEQNTEATIEVVNEGPSAINAFEIRRRSDRMTRGYVLANSTTSFQNPEIMGTTGPDGVFLDPTTLASGASVHLEVPFGANTIIEVWARVASGMSIIQVAGES